MPAAENIDNRISEIQFMVASDNVQGALQRSMDLARDCCRQQNDILHTVIVISSNFTKLNKESTMGILAPEKAMEARTRLLFQLLGVVDQIQGSVMAMA